MDEPARNTGQARSRRERRCETSVIILNVAGRDSQDDQKMPTCLRNAGLGGVKGMSDIVTRAKINEAAKRIRSVVPPTPTKASHYLHSRTGQKVHLKLENLNISGSFKIRGAANALMQADAQTLKHGVIAASAGNHAQGVAHICRRLGARATIFMPERTPMVKSEETRALGAEIRFEGATYDDAYAAAVKFQAECGGVLVHPFADVAVICGQGTVALELLDQVPDIGMLIVPIGGGGLISGMACAIKEANPSIRIIGVQTAAYPSAKLSVEAGKIVPTGAASTIADGIAVKRPSELTFELIRRYVDDIVLVEEDAIAASVMDLMERDHLLAEGCGAVTSAALLSMSSSQIEKVKGKAIVCVVSGGNIDVNLLAKISTRGLIYTGRMMRISVRLEDRPGKLAELLNVVGASGANLIEVQHNRAFGMTYFDQVVVDLDIETINSEHQKKILGRLGEAKFVYTRIGPSSHG